MLDRMMGEGARPVLDVRALPGTRESVAYRDGGLFPVLALADPGIVVAVLRGGAGHLGLAGRIDIVRSFDAGLTWSPPAVVVDSERDDRNPALGRAPDGTLVLVYQCQGSYDQDGVYRPALRDADGTRPVELMVTRSPDAGLSWSAPAPLGMAALAAGSPFGKIVGLEDGTLLVAIYAPSDDGVVSSHVARSTDGGRSWADPSLVARAMNETALLAVPGGGLVAVMRGADRDQALFGARSHDGGRTWSEPRRVALALRHPGDLVALASGDILLTHGNRAPPYRIEGLVSRDEGETWGDCMLVFSGALHGYTGRTGRATDLGYPSTVIRRADGEGRGVTVYYHDPSCGCRSGGEPGGEPSHLRPPYRAAGYLASAVTWREDELIDAIARLDRRR